MTDVDGLVSTAYAEHGDSLELLTAVDRAVGDGRAGPARAAYERGGARDSLGQEAEAVPLYRQALELGLEEPHRLRCLVQLGSSLRNVGDAAGAVAVLRSAREQAPPEAADHVDAFYALALHSDGQPAEALSVALAALAPHLAEYGRAVMSYAADLTGLPEPGLD